jgi:riboflavin kinase/FMN adenylyltransferase
VQVVREPGPCARPDEGSVVAIGVFDGVHLGHQHVVAEARRLAAERRALSAVVTFDRHPAAVVRPESAPKLLTDLDQRLELLAGLGMDLTYVVSFDEPRSKESAEDFVETVLVQCLAAKVRFVARLRDELRFDSVDDLVRQMASDVDETRAVLRWSPSPG